MTKHSSLTRLCQSSYHALRFHVVVHYTLGVSAALIVTLAFAPCAASAADTSDSAQMPSGRDSLPCIFMVPDGWKSKNDRLDERLVCEYCNSQDTAGLLVMRETVEQQMSQSLLEEFVLDLASSAEDATAMTLPEGKTVDDHPAAEGGYFIETTESKTRVRILAVSYATHLVTFFGIHLENDEASTKAITDLFSSISFPADNPPAPSPDQGLTSSMVNEIGDPQFTIHEMRIERVLELEPTFWDVDSGNSWAISPNGRGVAIYDNRIGLGRVMYPWSPQIDTFWRDGAISRSDEKLYFEPPRICVSFDSFKVAYIVKRGQHGNGTLVGVSDILKKTEPQLFDIDEFLRKRIHRCREVGSIDEIALSGDGKGAYAVAGYTMDEERDDLLSYPKRRALIYIDLQYASMWLYQTAQEGEQLYPFSTLTVSSEGSHIGFKGAGPDGTKCYPYVLAQSGQRLLQPSYETTQLDPTPFRCGPLVFGTLNPDGAENTEYMFFQRGDKQPLTLSRLRDAGTLEYGIDDNTAPRLQWGLPSVASGQWVSYDGCHFVYYDHFHGIVWRFGDRSVTDEAPAGRIGFKLLMRRLEEPFQVRFPPGYHLGNSYMNYNASRLLLLKDHPTNDKQDRLMVVDVKPPEKLKVHIADKFISEGRQTTGTVTRPGTSGPVVVSLSSNDLTEAVVPAMVPIMAGAKSSPPFPIIAVEDNVKDGTQTVTITGSADFYIDDQETLKVTDDENGKEDERDEVDNTRPRMGNGKRLTLMIQKKSISENGGVTTVVVTRNGPFGTVIVFLTIDDGTEARVIQAVLILDGQATSTPFTIHGVDDSILDGTQTVTITAKAQGYRDATGTLDVTDDETMTSPSTPPSQGTPQVVPPPRDYVQEIGGNMAAEWGFAHGSLRTNESAWNAVWRIGTVKPTTLTFQGAFKKQAYRGRVLSGTHLKKIADLQEVTKLLESDSKTPTYEQAPKLLGEVSSFSVEDTGNTPVPLQPGEYLILLSPESHGNIGWKCNWPKAP
jgi:hypothetical protein